jgi:hypothetical protein
MKEGCIALSCFECHPQAAPSPLPQDNARSAKTKMNIWKDAAGNREDAMERSGPHVHLNAGTRLMEPGSAKGTPPEGLYPLKRNDPMSIKTLSAIAIVTAALTGPASAQYDRVYGPGYYGPAYGYGPVYGPRTFRGAFVYNAVPVVPFYGDGWVPESIYDRSRVGSIDPTIRPFGN